MKPHTLIFIFITFFQSISYSQEPSISEQFRRQWIKYSDLPNQSNAIEFDRFLTKLHNTKTIDRVKLSSFRDDFYNNYDMLERQMLSRDSLAIKIAYKIYPLTDGHFAEMICISLGQLIRIDPKLFLEQTLANQKYVDHLDGILGNYGSAYVDKRDAQTYEKNLRVKALKSVHDSTLTDIKEKCLLIMNE